MTYHGADLQNILCNKCNTIKPICNFYHHKKNSSGVRTECKLCSKTEALKYYHNGDKVAISIRRKAKYIKNKDRENETNKQWIINNKEKRREKRRELYKNNINHKIASCVRSRIRVKLRVNNIKKSKLTNEYLGCSIDFFRSYLAKKFKTGMTWNNYGYGEDCWNIDHIKPCSWFDLSDEKQQLECFHYTNCQPMWQIENMSKLNRYEGDYVPLS